MRNGREITQIERVEIAQWVIANEVDYSGAMEKYDVSYGQIYSWIQRFKQGGPENLVDRHGKRKSAHDQLTEEQKRDLEVRRLKARIEHLLTENAVLKKLQELERKKMTTLLVLED